MGVIAVHEQPPVTVVQADERQSWWRRCPHCVHSQGASRPQLPPSVHICTGRGDQVVLVCWDAE